jgi:hypothetical protein
MTSLDLSEFGLYIVARAISVSGWSKKLLEISLDIVPSMTRSCPLQMIRCPFQKDFHVDKSAKVDYSRSSFSVDHLVMKLLNCVMQRIKVANDWSKK